MEPKEIGKKDLTCKEIARIWKNKKGEDGFNVNTFKDYIKKLCDMGMGLKKEYFMENGEYIVRKDVQGLFFCLIDSNLLKKKNRRSILYNGELNHELLGNIDKWLDEEDQKKIKNSPIYKSIMHNDTLVREYFDSWWKLNKAIFSADTYIRYRLINIVKNHIQECCINVKRTKMQAKIRKMELEVDFSLNTELGYVTGNNLAELIVTMMVSKLKRDEEEKTFEKAGWIKDSDKSFELIYNNICFPSVKPEDIMQRKIYVAEKYRTRCENVKKRIEKVFGDNNNEKIIKEMIMDLLDICYSLPDDDVKKFAKSFYEDKKNWEELYIDYFTNYQKIQEILDTIRSEEYKKYKEYKEYKEYKKHEEEYKEYTEHRKGYEEYTEHRKGYEEYKENEKLYKEYTECLKEVLLKLQSERE